MNSVEHRKVSEGRIYYPYMLNLHHDGHLTLEGLEEFGVGAVLGLINHLDGVLLPSGLINSKLDISKVSAGRDDLTAK